MTELNSLDIDDDIKNKTFQKLNQLLGNDITKISLCSDLYVHLKKKKEELEAEIFSLPEKFKSVSQDIEKFSHQLSDLTLDNDCLKKRIGGNENNEEPFYEQLSSYKKQLENLQNSFSYLEILQFIEDTCTEIERLSNGNNDEKCAEHYKSLCTLQWNLSSSACSHLITYLKHCIIWWHNILKEKFCRNYENTLKELKWPFVSIGNALIDRPPTMLQPEFQRLTKLLLTIQLPNICEEIQITQLKIKSNVLANFTPLCIPVSVLLSSLEKRFLYHFCGDKPTNRLDKPEWMFTQVLKYIKDHEDFLDEWVQPVFEEVFESLPNSAKLEFVIGLVEMVAKRLQIVLDQLLNNDFLFSHAIDETLCFNKELSHQFGYPSSYPSVLSVLTLPQIFIKWTNIERKFAKEKMDELISMETAWNILFENDKCKVTECSDIFITLLITINARYTSLPQPGHRLQFLEIQLELIDEFRIRLLQLLHDERNDPLNSKLTNILNTFHYVVTILSEWGNNTHFIMLHHYKKQVDPDLMTENSASVFDDALYLMNRIIEELIALINETVILEVKAKSRHYRNDRWHAMPAWNSVLFPSLTPSASPMFIILANSLHQLRAILAPDLFQQCWGAIAKDISQMIIEDVILENTFNEGGAQQLHFDVRRNLLPLFSQYTSKPDAYFMPLLEACSLLCLDKSFKADSIPVSINVLKREYIDSILDRRIEWNSAPIID